jgi:hypothetical protein
MSDAKSEYEWDNLIWGSPWWSLGQSRTEKLCWTGCGMIIWFIATIGLPVLAVKWLYLAYYVDWGYLGVAIPMIVFCSALTWYLVQNNLWPLMHLKNFRWSR